MSYQLVNSMHGSRNNLRSTLFALGCLCVFLLLASDSVAASPAGATKIGNDRLVKKGNFYCGYLKGKWLPGKRLANGYFYPHQSERANRKIELKKAPKRRKAKLQAQIDSLTNLIATRTGECSTEGESSNGGGGASTPAKKPLRFDLSGAVGLTLKSIGGSQSLTAAAAGELSVINSSSSNLQKVDSSGAVSSAVSSGSAVVSKFLIAPNDKLYVLFNQGTNLGDTGSSGSCLLAEVDKNTGDPKCIDDDARAIHWLSGIANASIQFDASGAIYYLAINNDYHLTLRRFNGQRSNELINDNISIYDFLVVPDGSVIMYGSTDSSGQPWIRKLSTTGSLRTIKSVIQCNTSFNFMKVFPDNKLYLGMDDCSPGGIYRMEQTADTLEPQPWMGHSYWMESLPTPVAFDCSMPADPALRNVLPQGCGALVRQSFRTPDGKMFFVGNNRLFKYYPTVEQATTAVNKPNVALGILGYVVLAGLNSSDRNVLTLFNTLDSSEMQLIGPESEIEVYHLNYVSSTNRLMFDGLRFSDNKYVIGQYDLNTMTFTASQTGGTKLVDFQTF